MTVVRAVDPSCQAPASATSWTRVAPDSRPVDLLSLPFPDESFDIALSYRLLSHVTRWPDLVRELCRVARRAVLVDYPTFRSVNAVAEPLFALKKGVEGNTRPFTVFGDAEIEAAFAAHGFHPTGRRPQFFWPMALHRALGLALSRVAWRGSPPSWASVASSARL